MLLLPAKMQTEFEKYPSPTTKGLEPLLPVYTAGEDNKRGDPAKGLLEVGAVDPVFRG